MSQARIPSVCLTGVPFHYGQPLNGVQYGPAILREHGLIATLNAKNIQVTDHGDLSFQSPELDLDETSWNFISDSCKHIAKCVEQACRDSTTSLVIGGDHSISLGSVCGALRKYPDLSVIWVDAHGDLNTPETSPSGNFHGMPLAGLLHQFSSSVLDSFSWLDQILLPSRLVLLGVRALDPGEMDLIRALNLKVYTMADVQTLGIDNVLNQAMRYLRTESGRPIHLSFDIDALDPSLAPSTGTPTADGLTISEAKRICQWVSERGNLVSMDMVEVNPFISSLAIDVAQTSRAAIEIIAAAVPES